MAESQRNVFDAFESIDQINTVDSDVEPNELESDDEDGSNFDPQSIDECLYSFCVKKIITKH